MYMLYRIVYCAQAAADKIAVTAGSDRIKIIIANVGGLMEVHSAAKEQLIMVNHVD